MRCSSIREKDLEGTARDSDVFCQIATSGKEPVLPFRHKRLGSILDWEDAAEHLAAQLSSILA